MPRGAVSDELVEFHAEVARGGTALTTVAYCSVSESGRVHRDTLVLDSASVPGLRRLTDAVHAEGALASAQIGHAGLVANQISNGMSTIAPSTRISAPAMGLVRGASLQQLDDIVESYASAARNAVDAGFDAIEVHLGHNYLLSSFMSRTSTSARTITAAASPTAPHIRAECSRQYDARWGTRQPSSRSST